MGLLEASLSKVVDLHGFIGELDVFARHVEISLACVVMKPFSSQLRTKSTP